MTQDCGGRGKNAKAIGLGLDSGIVSEAFSDALRVHVGRGKPWSVEALAAETGIDFATVKGYHAGAHGPSLAKFLKIAAVLPDEFLNRIIGHIGYGAAVKLDPDQVSVLTVNRRISDLIAMFGEFMEDGKVDHRETALYVDAARQLLPFVQDLIASHDGEGGK